ncbi:hypothetical protein PAPHI01_1676 [Pancytospora philotis]|nr:hypothetical protein PAPHI01_1676 [Pancytospora philotis]
MDAEKYDRQIRLFGKSTQERLCGLTVQILGHTSFIPCEIAKNVTLLGVKKLVLEEAVLAKTKRIVPSDLQVINEQLEIELAAAPVDSDFLFVVDGKEEHPGRELYSVCSSCFLIQKNRVEHVCDAAGMPSLGDDGERSGLVSAGMARLAGDCLAGALAVQEFVKIIEGREPGLDSYRVSI